MSTSPKASLEGILFVDLMDHSMEISRDSNGSSSSMLVVSSDLRVTGAPAPAIRDISMTLSDSSSG